jgi:hypothetical protein
MLAPALSRRNNLLGPCSQPVLLSGAEGGYGELFTHLVIERGSITKWEIRKKQVPHFSRDIPQPIRGRRAGGVTEYFQA